MTQYIFLAETIIKSLEKKQQLEEDIFKNIGPIILELKRKLQNSHLILNIEITKKLTSELSNPFKCDLIDLSLVPKISNRDEFILWLASLIQKITVDTTYEVPIPLSVIHQIPETPKVSLKQKKNKKEHIDIFTINDEFCNAINDYFNKMKKRF